MGDCCSGRTWVGCMESDIVLKDEVLYSLLLFLFSHENSTSCVASVLRVLQMEGMLVSRTDGLREGAPCLVGGFPLCILFLH